MTRTRASQALRTLIVGVIATGWLAEIAFLGHSFANGGTWDRIALGAILLIAIPSTWQLARIGCEYLRTGQ